LRRPRSVMEAGRMREGTTSSSSTAAAASGGVDLALSVRSSIQTRTCLVSPVVPLRTTTRTLLPQFMVRKSCTCRSSYS